MPHLAVVLPPGTGAAPDSTAGRELRALAARWPGRVSVVLHRPGAMHVVDAAVPDLASAGVDVVAGEPLAAVGHLGAHAVRMPLDPRLAAVAHRLPSVVAADATATQRLRYLRPAGPATLPLTVTRGVRELWTARGVLAAADGLQCNGWAAWAAYHEQAQVKHRVPPLLHFDSVLTAAEVSHASPRARPGGPPEGVLRLVFVGRLHPADGPQFAVAASRLLTRWGVDHELTLHGDGPLTDRLRASAPPEVRFAEPVGTGTGRMSPVATGADVAVLPYLHSYPTGVELELAGLGVPVVGFGTALLEGHRRFAGFTVTALPRSSRSLASALRGLAASPARREALGARGIGFMSRHHVEARRDAQVEHLLRVAGPTRTPR
jgi:glycosyltransferase involved in cell wall biosynthesis